MTYLSEGTGYGVMAWADEQSRLADLGFTKTQIEFMNARVKAAAEFAKEEGRIDALKEYGNKLLDAEREKIESILGIELEDDV